jgi:site-specific DNA-methyltransferase (adenine-specific)
MNANKAPLKCFENILVFSEGACRYNPQMESGRSYFRDRSNQTYKSPNYRRLLKPIDTINHGVRYPLNVLPFPSVPPSKIEHPTQKPVELCEYLIKTYTAPGEVVLDVCAGSGTTAVAAVNTGRDWLAFETDPGYCVTAARRIDEAMTAKERSLFHTGFPPSVMEAS